MQRETGNGYGKLQSRYKCRQDANTFYSLLYILLKQSFVSYELVFCFCLDAESKHLKQCWCCDRPFLWPNYVKWCNNSSNSMKRNEPKSISSQFGWPETVD